MKECVYCGSFYENKAKLCNRCGAQIKKPCSKCRVKKPLADFYKDKKSRTGVATQCKTCLKEYAIQYYNKHKETILEQRKEYQKEYRKRNKIKIKEI